MSLSDFPDILGSAEDGREGGGVLRVGFPGLQGGDSGGPTIPHHLQCGGEYGVKTLVQGDGGGIG